MWMIDDFWNECEQRGFTRVENPGKVVYRLPETLGSGQLELWGDPSTAVFYRLDFTLNQPWHVWSHTDERYMQFSERSRPEADSPAPAGQQPLRCFVNYPLSSSYRSIPAGVRQTVCCLVFREKFFDRLSFRLPADFWETATHILNGEPFPLTSVSDILRQIESSSLSGEALTMLVYGKACEAMAQMMHHAYAIRSASSVRLTERDRAVLESVEGILLQRLENPPGIQDLAQETGLNQQKLMTGFRQVYNTTIYGALKQMRMKRAAELLQSTDLPVLEIARMVGYHGDGHFQKAFKDVYNTTPHKLRKAVRF